MNNVELQFLNSAIVQPGGWMVFSKSDAIDFVEACKKEGIQIMGIDGFYIAGKFIQPSIEHSIDYTTGGAAFDCKHEDAINFLLDQDDETMYFEIVTAEA